MNENGTSMYMPVGPVGYGSGADGRYVSRDSGNNSYTEGYSDGYSQAMSQMRNMDNSEHWMPPYNPIRRY